jgi:hypothetical protein
MPKKHIIVNFHNSNYTNLEKLIKYAVTPLNIYEHIDVNKYNEKSKEDCLKYDLYYSNCDVLCKDIIRKISIINLSKYLNSMTQIEEINANETNNIKVIHWYDNGKKKKIEIENIYMIGNDNIKLYYSIDWDIQGNIKNRYMTQIINGDLNSALNLTI